jgi:hypothetical protein
VSKPPDILAVCLCRIRTEIGKPDGLDLERIERELRLEYGGDCHRVYCKPPDLPARIMADLDSGQTVENVTRRYGVSRATVYRARLK